MARVIAYFNTPLTLGNLMILFGSDASDYVIDVADDGDCIVLKEPP